MMSYAMCQILKGKKLAAFLRLNAIAISGASRTKKPFQAYLYQ
jgi:hypothetical protein